eukprot:4598246-Amphidinium_carterae.1
MPASQTSSSALPLRAAWIRLPKDADDFPTAHFSHKCRDSAALGTARALSDLDTASVVSTAFVSTTAAAAGGRDEIRRCKDSDGSRTCLFATRGRATAALGLKR